MTFQKRVAFEGCAASDVSFGHYKGVVCSFRPSSVKPAINS